MKFKTKYAALLITPALFIAAPASACQENTQLNLSRTELINTAFADLQRGDKDPVIYNFHTHKCEALSLAHTDAQMSAHLPNDEEWQELYTEFRHKGEDSSHALKHVFNFKMEDDESAGWLPSRSKQMIEE